MKRITKSLIAVIAIATTIVACTKDNTSTDPMLGKWTIDSVVESQPNSAPQTINLNGSCTVKNYFDLKTGGIIEDGQVNTQTCQLAKVPGTWKKTNNTLQIVDDSTNTTFNIMSVTTNKLVLRISDLGTQVPAGTYVEATLSK